MRVTLAAFAPRQIIFKIVVERRGGHDPRHRLPRQRRASEVGVQHDARCVNHAAQRRRQNILHFGNNQRFQFVVVFRIDRPAVSAPCSCADLFSRVG